MAKRYQWPRCTHTGCSCVRTWETESAVQSALARHLGNWTQGRLAICSCHPDPTFPCDKSLEKTASV